MLTELSYVLGESIPKWPTNPSERLEKVLCFEAGDQCNAFSVYHHMHNGTHVDAPKHFSPGGRAISDIPIEDFYYTAPLVISLDKKKGDVFTREDLARYEIEIERADILFIHTGYSNLRERDPAAYIDDFPAFCEEAALYLRRGFPRLKAVALDVISVDKPTGQGFPAHKAFLDTNDENNTRTILLFEDVNIQKLINLQAPVKAVYAFPIRWEGAEAAPVSMVAIS